MTISSIGSQSLWAIQRSSSQWTTARTTGQGTTSQSDSVSISQQGFAALMAGGGPPPMTDELAAKIGSQLQEDHPDLFTSLDTDEDGSLSAEELEAGKDQVRETLGPPRGGRPEMTDELAAKIGAHMQERDPDLFAELDADEDGTLSATELKDGKDKIHARMQEMGPPPGAMAGGPPPGFESDSSTDEDESDTDVIQTLLDSVATNQAGQYRSNLLNDILRSLFSGDTTSQQA